MSVNIITRASIIRGPAIATFNSAVFYFKGDMKVELKLTVLDIDVDAFGAVIDGRVINRDVKVTGVPSGNWEAVQAVALPYGASAIGSSIFGSDKALTINTLAGTQIVFNAAAVTKLPDIYLSSAKTMLGSMEWTCIGTDNTDWAAANQLYTVSSVAFSDTSFTEPGIITDQWNGVWGSSAPWNAISTKDGFVISFDLGLEPVETDAEGLVDMTLTKLVATAKFMPVGVTETQLLGGLLLQGTGAQRGRSLNATANNLVITGVNSTKVITIGGANFVTADMGFGKGTLRAGEVALRSTRTFTAGAPASFFTVT